MSITIELSIQGALRSSLVRCKNLAPLPSTGDPDLKIARAFYGCKYSIIQQIHYFFFVPTFSMAFLIWSEIAAALSLTALDFSIATL